MALVLVTLLGQEAGPPTVPVNRGEEVPTVLPLEVRCDIDRITVIALSRPATGQTRIRVGCGLDGERVVTDLVWGQCLIYDQGVIGACPELPTQSVVMPKDGWINRSSLAMETVESK